LSKREKKARKEGRKEGRKEEMIRDKRRQGMGTIEEENTF